MWDLNKLWIRLTSKFIAEDKSGNQYFESNKHDYLGKKVRQVVYKGSVEPSKVPPMFHAWLHHLTNEIPKEPERFTWQKDHIANLTGTKLAYSPCLGHNKRSKVASDYQAWQPK
jgi:NADH:ubiquinone oxidoreductase subunit